MPVRSPLHTLLPPPAFLQMRSVGVDISDTSLKYVEFTPQRHGLDLTSWGDVDIPSGVLKRGVVHDVKKLATAIAKVKEETDCSLVRVSLPEERAYLFETEIKKDTPFKEVRGLLEFRLEENVPLSPRDAVFDYTVMDDSLRGDTTRVSVTVYARETIMNYFEACTVAGVTPVSFEVEAQAIARSTLQATDVATHMILDFGKTRTGIGIVHAGTLMYTSTIEIGGIHLSAELRKVLGAEVAESELTKIKNTSGLVSSSATPAVQAALSGVMMRVVEEIRARLDYWNVRVRDHDERQIQSIILCGGSANMRGLPGFFAEQLHIDSMRANVWQNAFDIASTAPPIGRRYSYGYATAIGLALANYSYD